MEKKEVLSPSERDCLSVDVAPEQPELKEPATTDRALGSNATVDIPLQWTSMGHLTKSTLKVLKRAACCGSSWEET